ncbi:LOW QUALITY PROTEIN: odorant receptor 46a-like isoform X1 [Vespula squamosa]|uniref:Odorant receptor 46a-like isoform X1 n=1 Tax=Vespula squamosa TaxID=30214 RepID=A0ABD2B3C7_VESSQ
MGKERESCAFESKVTQRTDDIMTSKSIDYFQDRYYVFNRRLLTFVGLWPYQESSKRLLRVNNTIFVLTSSRYRVSMKSFNFIFNLRVKEIMWDSRNVTLNQFNNQYLSSTYRKIFMFIVSDLNMELIIEMMQLFLPNLCFSFCYWNLNYNIVKVKEMLDRINSDWVILENQRELMIMEKYAKIGRLCTLTTAFIFYLIFLFLLFPRYGFDETKNDTRLVLLLYTDYICKNKICYYFILLTSCVSASIICAVGVTHYSMYASFVQHTCALLKVVTYIVFFQLIALKGNKGKMLSNCIYIIGSIFMTYVGCYSGQRVIDHNTNVTRKIHQVSFYELSIKTQKALLLLTMKIMNPCNFSMMGTMVTSHELFLNIMQKSFSFAMNNRHMEMSDVTETNDLHLSYKYYDNRWNNSIEPKINLITKLLEITLPTLCFGFCYWNLLLKITIVRNSLKMKKILCRIKCDWVDLANKPELEILEKYANHSRLITIVIAISFNLYIAFLMFPSLLRILQYIFGVISKTELILPVAFDYFMNNQMIFFLALLYEYVGMCILSMVGVANYSMFIAVIQHACGLFKIVTWKIDERFNKNQHNFCPSVIYNKSKKDEEWIIGIIKFYNNIDEFIDLIKSCYKNIFIVEILLGLLLIIVDYYYVLSLPLNLSERLTKFNFIIGSMFVIYASYHIGQKLTDHHTDLSISVLFFITKNAKAVALFYNEKHEVMQSFCIWSFRHITSPFWNAIALFPQIYMLFTSEPNINLITKLLETTLPTICFGSCYYNLLLKTAIMKKILRRIKCDWVDLANKPELRILKKYANVSKLSTIVIAISFNLYIVFLMFPSLLRILQYIFGVISKTELILPVDFDYCMNNQMFFFLALLYEYVGMCIVSMVGVANYSMFIAVIQHACALFNIIECQIPFYSLSLKTQKLLLLLVMKTMKPCYLSVKGVVVVSHYTFAKID